jgi:alkylation response protein AidB-like acyl-CoA dehydrogenase
VIDGVARMSVSSRSPEAVDRGDLVAVVSDFARREVAPGAARRDEQGGFDRELWMAMGQLGMHGLDLAEAHGGIGADLATTCEIARAFGRHGRDFGLGLSWISSMFAAAVPIARVGSDLQIDRYVRGLVEGHLIGAQANTEPHAGSDLKTIRTRAIRNGDEWVINGSKVFITNAPIADVILVLAVTRPDAGRQGMGFFVVDAGTPGMTVAAPARKMGASASPTAEVFFDDCRVPAGAVLGDPYTGFYDFLKSIQREVLVLTALTLGILEACMDQSAHYAQEREQFGHPISEYQAITHKLADMRIASEVGGAIVSRTAQLIDAQADARVEASAAKIFVSEAAVRAGLDAIQIHGGYGYMREYEVERLTRDVKLMTIGGGTSEVHRNMIAKQVLHGR